MNYEDRVTKTYIENALANAGAKIATGTYTGTGAYGASSPNTLSFDFAPKLLLVSLGEQYFSNANAQFVVFPFMLTTEYVNLNLHGSSFGNYFKVSADGKTVRWYVSTPTSGATSQYNEQGSVYSYLAIG